LSLCCLYTLASTAECNAVKIVILTKNVLNYLKHFAESCSIIVTYTFEMSKPSTKRKIIIFDDDEDILSICSYVLEEEGWEVSTFTDCNDIVEKVSGIIPDVILMDNWIPDSGGIVATQMLKKTDALKNIPVVYFSANSDIQSLAKNAGAETYLSKPFDLNELEQAIENVLAPGIKN
jgi:DNA-binding NtrC family response regulator